ncbi:response regulator transcription factor [Paenibacillus sacheonensis]|uniref:Response regulator n=1 Tax=Paenibacillus sacheonensis TaxID=742054 RepID=A0A7X5C1N0_9BACL|nr:response regulator transcription factor [Paenibacillus sacheonensis]MBM7567249.1 two-component system response regulator YesN [Paenibacillus sacheonensis]NBC72856.1 response regulator [Paenibacillus sacheonensis]
MVQSYCKVLIVDDELLARQGIKHLFDWESEGFMVVGEAANGKEALALIQSLQPHIVITDIVMPVMDGEELSRHIKAGYPDIEIVVLSSFSEFEYVRSTFQSGAADYILKPKLDAGHLLAILKKIAAGIPSLQGLGNSNACERSLRAVLDKLIAGYALNEEDEAVSKERFPYASYALLALEREETSGRRDRLGPASSMPISGSLLPDTSVTASQAPASPLPMHAAQMLGWAESRLRSLPKGAPVVFSSELPQDDGLVRLLLNFDESYEAPLIALVKQLGEELETHDMPLFAALSPTFRQITELTKAYHAEVPKLLESRFFHPHGRMFMETESETGYDGEPVPFDVTAFNRELNEQSFAHAFGRLRLFLAALPATPRMSIQECKSFLGHQVFAIILALLRFEYPAAKLDERKYDYFRSIHEAKHVDEAEGVLLRFLEEAEACVADRSRPSGSQSMHKLLTYIQEHYAEPLSLADMAAHFHFNPSYLSNYFASHNKEGFSEHVNRVRIEKACELLRNGDMTISEVSSQVGYSDHSYFTKVFRKLKGISPSQYRRNAQDGRDAR